MKEVLFLTRDILAPSRGNAQMNRVQKGKGLEDLEIVNNVKPC